MTDAPLGPGDPLALLKARKQTKTQRVSLCMDDGLTLEVTAARRALADAEHSVEQDPGSTIAAERLTAAQERARAAEQAADAETVVFVFAPIGRQAWQALMEAHPPTPEQSKAALARMAFGGLAFNPETFPAAAIAASAKLEVPDSDPVELPFDLVASWYDNPAWNAGDLNTLFDVAQMVNLGSRVSELGKDSGSTRS